MRFLSKLGLKSKAAPIKAPEVTSTSVAEKPSTTAGIYSAPSEFVSPAAVSDDEPTAYTTFMIFYLGFFGVVGLVYPQLFAASWNPFPYWLAFPDELVFVFRIVGAALTTLAIGPFFDEIFGGAGVALGAFARQTLLLNTLMLVLFLYYTFYAPLSTANLPVWQAQTLVQACLVGWAIIECVSVSSLRSMYVVFHVGYFGFFALVLIAYPALFTSTASPLAYWDTDAPLDAFAARGTGTAMATVALVLYVLCSSSGGYVKLLTAYNLVMTGLLLGPAYYGGDAVRPALWRVSAHVGVPMLLVGIYLEGCGATGAWRVGIACPPCKLVSAELYNFVQIFWFAPFIVGFYAAPNELFGPDALTGMPMFTSPFAEPALWFTKAWVSAMACVILAPYLFGLPHQQVLRAYVAGYVLNIGLFAYALLALGIMNTPVVAPLVGVQVLFLGWAAVIVAKADDAAML